MKYIIIQPQFNLKFHEGTKKELEEYYKWFMDILPDRINILTRAIQYTPGYERWQPDLMPASLEMLGKWFAENVETRYRTQEEKQEIKDRLIFSIDIPEIELTNRTFSIAIDIGMYLSQVLLKNHPSLKWEQPFGNRRYTDYGQPVLEKFSNAPLNPVRIMIVLARSLADKTKTGERLKELYDIWSKMVVID